MTQKRNLYPLNGYCLSNKEETTCIGNGNSGENPKRFNVKNARRRDSIKNESYFALCFVLNITKNNSNSKTIDGFVTTEPARATCQRNLQNL